MLRSVLADIDSMDPVAFPAVATALFPGVHSDPEILGGAPVFVGPRVPVRALFDHLELVAARRRAEEPGDLT